MSEELLPYYNRELSYIRRLGAQFAEAHPKIAGRLRLGPDAAEDPHVERLIEAFAYLNARTRLKLEDEFPEITESLLGVLYPHYQAPLPSMAIVQFELDPEQNELTTGHTIPRHSLLETEPIDGEPCRFRTAYRTTLWPIRLAEAALARPPFAAPVTRHTAAAASVLRLVLEHRGKASFAALELGSLRFFLKGQPQQAYKLYELILNHTLGVAVASSPNDGEPVLLRPDCLRPVGFERDEGLLPYTARSLSGYRLLTEYFAYPQKFLFFDLAGLSRRTLARLGGRMEIYLYLDREASDLEQLSADNFRLGCTPIVNLYPKRAEPIQLTHTDFEHRVAPDARRPRSHEVYSIDRVTASAPSGEAVEYRPFFSVKHAQAADEAGVYWHAARRAGEAADGRADGGTEVYLSLVDLNREPAATADWTLDVEATCLNRDLPARLPFGGGQPRLQLSEGDALVSSVSCVTAPTPTLRPARRRGALWRLVSHLSLNHLSLVNDGKADALREILKLYDFADSPQTRQTIDGVVEIGSRRVACRLGGAVVQGVETTLTFDAERFSGGGLFLFASVLERFLSLYCSLNSFTKLTALVKGREQELRRWPPRTGERILV
ncbi:MAG TPA: type VI secretion system baseplate subunit TssF [Gemmataceae bacterium]|nr:type VI secretion system baseplate subunit TssF [Gemmataceae bacterium]